MSFGGGIDSFGSFKYKAKIRRKGAGSSISNRARYDQLEAEIDRKEALQEFR
eukprot:CAMPEP_0170482492 /NCGR_PEP_ID=MMETSP0208-20121228/2490_1 /TAXON_ID=197538 /ORGANISM="Strombidium inclinatum, Strain S3" /LENGTH=51 /DNA_ID=CAMNT_0010755337 /DNA_START=23 /DNA_END=178 /DNA_ORIENTATION=+